MTVIRVNRVRRSGFTTLAHHAVRNAHLSRSARGLLWELCSHGTSFDVTIDGLVSAAPDGKHRLLQARAALEAEGYLRVEIRRDSGGHVAGMDWIVTDDPDSFPLPGAENRRQGSLDISAPEADQLAPGNRIQEGGPSIQGVRSNKEEVSEPQVNTEGNAPLALALTTVKLDPVDEMHRVWQTVLGNGRPLTLTAGRRQKYRAMYDEQLRGLPDPMAALQAVLVAVRRSDHHMSVRGYQLPESLFKSPERRDRWVQETVALIDKERVKSTAAADFAAAFRARQSRNEEPPHDRT